MQHYNPLYTKIIHLINAKNASIMHSRKIRCCTLVYKGSFITWNIKYKSIFLLSLLFFDPIKPLNFKDFFNFLTILIAKIVKF